MSGLLKTNTSGLIVVQFQSEQLSKWYNLIMSKFKLGSETCFEVSMTSMGSVSLHHHKHECNAIQQFTGNKQNSGRRATNIRDSSTSMRQARGASAWGLSTAT